ncbi:MAG: alpha/beta fold hydrolase [Cyanobacteria bacterium SZAS-4]|nr:alpha/beta fold hydrolase [Cyanobacteria bacterium SZAS-4]
MIVIPPTFKRLLLNAAVISGIVAAAPGTPASALVQRTDNGMLAQKLGIPLYEWQDDANPEPKLIFLAVHGFTQQGLCFDVLARDLASRGYLVVAPDLRGHGRWIGNTGSTNNDFNVSCDDESRLLVQLRKSHPGAKIFGMGESAGCAVLLKAVSNEPKAVKGLILCAAGVEPHIHKPGGMGPKFIMGMAKLVEPVDLTDYYAKYVSDDKRTADEMVHDPLNKSHQSALSLIGTMNFISQMPVLASQVPRSIPVLLLQGTDDQIVNAASVSRVYDGFKTSDKSLKEIAGCGHILLGTAFIKPIVLNDTFDWLGSHGGLPVATAADPNNAISSANSNQKTFTQKLKGKFHL